MSVEGATVTTRARTLTLTLAELYAALSAERVTLVTPNRRLAAYHKREFDRVQQIAGHLAWPTPDILPFGTFIERSWCALHNAADDARSPELIDGVPADMLWEQAIRNADPALAQTLMHVAQTATEAANAWTIAHAWHLLPALQKFALHEDAARFLDWSQRYRALCRERNIIDHAVLPELLAQSLQADAVDVGTLPTRILAVGFDIVTPQQHHLWRVLCEAGIEVDQIEIATRHLDTTQARVEFASDRDELAACAQWARAQLLRDPARRLAIVVPDLATRRSAVARALTDALTPMQRAQVGMGGVGGAGGAARARSNNLPLFNISLGQPLGDYALVRDALSLLAFSLRRPLPTLEASALLRSPFIAGAETGISARAALDAALRKFAASEISIDGLRNMTAANLAKSRTFPGSSGLAGLLDRALAAATPAATTRGKTSLPTTPHAWSRQFGRVLSAWGFPGERTLDTIDYQVMSKFRNALASLATLAPVQPRMRADEAWLQLRRIVAAIPFQPEQPEADGGGLAPIQVLGILESAGQSFDGLWVMGLHDEAWPLAARPHPFLPSALQRAAGVPQASPAASLALDQRITAGWLSSASEVVVSHAQTDARRAGDQPPRSVSPLVEAVTRVDAAALTPNPLQADYAHALQALGMREPIADAAFAPLPNPTRTRGGANVIRDQAACPFRAFARHRLGAATLETPEPGLDAAARGNLLHRMLYLVWGEIKDHATLSTLDKAAVERIVSTAASAAVEDARAKGADSLIGQFASLEIDRLARIGGAWIEYERERTSFAVVEREQSREVSLSGMNMTLRLDRLDRLADGTHALIDYKTGVAKLAGWLGTRPDDPQLPLYFSTADEAISVLAFARVKRGERGKTFGFEGLSAVADLLPDVLPIEERTKLKKQGYDSWDVLTDEWERALTALANDFMAGVATVDPKNAGVTCKQCDLHGLCRIAERGRYASETVEGETNEPDDA